MGSWRLSLSHTHANACAHTHTRTLECTHKCMRTPRLQHVCMQHQHRPQCHATAMKMQHTSPHHSAQGQPQCLHESCVRVCHSHRHALLHTNFLTLYLHMHTMWLTAAAVASTLVFLPPPLLDYHKHFNTPRYTSYMHFFILELAHGCVVKRAEGGGMMKESSKTQSQIKTLWKSALLSHAHRNCHR